MKKIITHNSKDYLVIIEAHDTEFLCFIPKLGGYTYGATEEEAIAMCKKTIDLALRRKK